MSLKERPNTATRKRKRRKAPQPAVSAWNDVMTKRDGAPPLRFKGRELARVEDARDGVATSITLWERKTRGYVAAVAAGRLVDSASSETLDGSMSWLEELCERDGPAPAHATVRDLLAATPTEIAAFRTLRILIGEALDRWDRLPGHGSE